MNKPISHYQRMNDPTLKQKVTARTSQVYEFVKSQTLNEDTGRITIKTSKQLVDYKSRYKHLKVTDFCMSNLQATGVELQPCKLLLTGNSAISHIEKTAQKISQSSNNN